MWTATCRSKRRGSVQAWSPISGITGTCQLGSRPPAWCQTKTMRLTSLTGHERTRAADGTSWQ
jgi:hypothetical protein